MMLRLLTSCALPAAVLGVRALAWRDRPEFSGGGLRVSAFGGGPELEVVSTSDEARAAAFLEGWSEAQDFGLYVRYASDEGAFAPKRVVMLAICRFRKVLLLDLRPFLGEEPRHLPRSIQSFFEKEHRTFYGMGLTAAAARLAFEFDLVFRCVDYNLRAWKEMQLGGGLYGVASRHFEMTFRRPHRLTEVPGQSAHAWLQWALAEYFLTFYGRPREDWLVTKAELFGAGPMYLRVAEPKHDWSEAMTQWMEQQRERAERRGRSWASAEGEEDGESDVESWESGIESSIGPEESDAEGGIGSVAG